MLRPKMLLALPIVGILAACANSGANYTPVIDGAAGPGYETDLAECQALAASGKPVDGRVAGAAATGAVLAGASSVIWDGNSSNLGEAAAVGALAGLTSGVVRRNNEQEAIVRNCMAGRGYRVIG